MGGGRIDRLLGVRADDASVAEVRHPGLDRLGLARGRSVSQAMVRSASVGPALQDPTWESFHRLASVEREIRSQHPRILRRYEQIRVRIG